MGKLPMEKGVTLSTLSFARIMRRTEWLGLGLALFLLSGAIFPLLLSDPGGGLGEAARSKLRMLGLPGLVIGLTLLVSHPAAAMRAMRNSIPMLALLSLPLVSVFWSVGPSVTMRRAIALLLAMTVAYVLAIRFTPRQQILLLGRIMGALTLLSLVAGLAMPGLALMPGETALRGLFTHKNVLGWAASLTVALGIAARMDPLPRMRKMGLRLVLIGIAGVLLSTSATGLLASITALGTAGAVRSISRRQGTARLLMLLLFLVLAIALAALLTLGLVPLLEFMGKDATLTGRVPLWRDVDAQIAQRPLLGYGYGAFWDYGNPGVWQIWANQGWQAPHAHNGFRDLLLDSGLLGLGLFALVTAIALGQGLALASAAPEEGWIFPIMVIVMSLVLNMSESTLMKQGDLYWVLFAAAVVSISGRYAELHRALPRQRRLAMTAI